PTLHTRAVALLARREYSRSELRAKLAGVRRDADAEAASSASGADVGELDAVLDDLAARGYLSDTRFAQQFARQKGGAYRQRARGATRQGRAGGGECAK